jgi:hypothetical protein
LSTIDNIVYSTKSKLDGAVGRDRVNTLSATINSSTTSVLTGYTPTPDLAIGSVIELDYEQMLVMNLSGSTLTVLRGWNNTDAVSHTGGIPMYVEPRFPKQAIFNEVVQELRAIPRSIYKVVTTTLNFPANVNQIDLTGATGEVFRILDAERKSFDGVGYPSFNLVTRLVRNQDTADYASGYSIQIDRGRFYKEDVDVRVTYAKTLDTVSLSTATNLQTTVGLPISAEDILTFGAASRLMYDKEALRLDFTRQGQSRNALEVPAETYAKQALRWRMEADRRTSEESRRLLDLYGFMGV